MAGVLEWTTIAAVEPSREKIGRIAANVAGKEINKKRPRPKAWPLSDRKFSPWDYPLSVPTEWRP